MQNNEDDSGVKPIEDPTVAAAPEPEAVAETAQETVTAPEGLDPTLIHSSPGEGRVGLYVSTPQVSAAPGGSAVLKIVVINQGEEPDPLVVSIDGVPPDWLASPPPTLQLPAGAHAEVELAFQPPRSPNSRAGRYPLTLQVARQAMPQEMAEAEVMLTVTAFSEFTSSLSPQQLEAERSGRVVIENHGNTPENYTVIWHDGGEPLIFDPAQAQVRLAEGQTGVAEFRAAPPRRRWVGQTRNHPYSVEISSSAGQVETHTGLAASRGWVPVWVPLILVFLCLTLSTTAALAFGPLFNPRSEAATQTALAAQATSANQLADADGDGLTTAEEAQLGTNPTLADTDGDGLSDGDERNLSTNPLAPDSDGDGLPDGVEVLQVNSGPLNPDSDDDGLSDGDEFSRGLNPLMGDTDGDGLFDNADPAPLQTSTPIVTVPVFTLPPVASATPAQFPTGTLLPTAVPPTAIPPTAVPPTPVPPPATPSGDRVVVFESRRDGNAEIYVMPAPGAEAPANGDLAGQTRLTNNPAEDTQPQWSPDGNYVAFISNRDGNNEIYILAAGGGAEVRLTNNTADDCCFAWSPDSLHLAFVSDRDGNREIYVMDPNGANQIRLTNNPGDDLDPVWGGGSNRLAFVSNTDNNIDIYVMEADGSAKTRLTDDPAADTDPGWSPDGKRMVFVSDRDGNPEVYVMNIDGSGQFRLTDNPAEDSGPVWSPASRRLVFVSNRDGNAELYLLDVEAALAGSPNAGPARLTNTPAADTAPAWSADGRRLVFVSERDGNAELYVMNMDCANLGSGCGATQFRLTNQAAPESSPNWRLRE